MNRNGLSSLAIAICALAAVAVPSLVAIVANTTSPLFITESSHGDDIKDCIEAAR